MNLDDEIRDGFHVTTQRKKLWKCQLDILKEVLDICRRNNIKVFADGGTLLGAIRHKGIIPWDDDIDVAMLREDYDRFCAIAAKELKEPYFLQNIYTDKLYDHRHSQVRDSRTTCIDSDGRYPTYNAGIFVDIFVYDSAPNTFRLISRMVRKVRAQQLKIKIIRKIGLYTPGWLFPAQKLLSKAFRQYEKTVVSFASPKNNYAGKIALHLREHIFDKADFDSVINMPFEDIEIPVPVGYDEILRLNYGDYMTPVKAPSGHGNFLFDTERSYRDRPDPATLNRL